MLRTAASVNQWDLCVISIYEGTTLLPCCHGFPSLWMESEETESRTLFSCPLPATGRLEASLSRMEMTSWILIIYLCTLLYLLIAWIFHLILKILIWNCQWSKAGKQNRAGYDFFTPFFFPFSPFGRNWSVKVILAYANFTRWSQHKCYILKLRSRKFKLTHTYTINFTYFENSKKFKDNWYILVLIQIKWFLLHHFIHRHTHALPHKHTSVYWIDKERTLVK